MHLPDRFLIVYPYSFENQINGYLLMSFPSISHVAWRSLLEDYVHKDPIISVQQLNLSTSALHASGYAALSFLLFFLCPHWVLVRFVHFSREATNEGRNWSFTSKIALYTTMRLNQRHLVYSAPCDSF